MNIETLFSYDRQVPYDLRLVSSQETDKVQVQNLTFAMPAGLRRAAYRVRPAAQGHYPGLLYVHWYEPGDPTSRRSEFLEEAREMARRGCISLLVETIWSDDDFFINRSQADDEKLSVQAAVELRRSLDFLLDDPQVDQQRVGFVGHDFGAMYGILMGCVDTRPACYALLAGTARFSDWFLYYPRLEQAERLQYIEQMTWLDPITHVSKLAPAKLFFQFGANDPHVPAERGQALFEAACQPKQAAWYEAGHGLNEQAAQERMAWLGKQLGLA
jgi:dienelactone hydrolase